MAGRGVLLNRNNQHPPDSSVSTSAAATERHRSGYRRDQVVPVSSLQEARSSASLDREPGLARRAEVARHDRSTAKGGQVQADRA